jgi:hypothetical protein
VRGSELSEANTFTALLAFIFILITILHSSATVGCAVATFDFLRHRVFTFSSSN